MYNLAKMGTRIEIKHGEHEDSKTPTISLQRGCEIVIYNIDLTEVNQGGKIRIKNLDDQVTAIHLEPNFPGDIKDPSLTKPRFLTENDQREVFQYKVDKPGPIVNASTGEVVVTHFHSR